MKKHLVVCLVILASLPLAAQNRTQRRLGRTPESSATERAREQWFYGRRAYPLARIPAGARLRGVEAFKALERAAGISPVTPLVARGARNQHHAITTDPVNWTLIGPQPTDQGFTDVASGRVNAVVLDPRNNNTVYIAAADGGVWKSTDGGNTWTPLTDQQASLASGALALDPSAPDTVYVGTGENNDAGDSYYGAGILKSTDGGNTWTNIVGPFLQDRITAIAVHPTNGNILLCASYAGVWRSTDAAATWTRVLGPSDGSANGFEVLFDPTNGSIAYAGIQFVGKGSGVYRSTDGGATWQQLTGSGANTLPTTNVGRVEVALAPSNPTTLFVQIQNSSNAHFGDLLGVWKSTDSGATWNQLKNAPAADYGSQLDYTNVLKVSPKDPNVLIAGALDLYRSLDGGDTWQTLPEHGPSGFLLHSDQHALAFTSDGTQLYIGNDGGMYVTTAITARNVSFTSLNDTLALTQFYPGMALDPQDPQFAVIGTQDNATQIYMGDPSWSYFDCGDGGMAVLDRLTSSNLYTSCAPGTIGDFNFTIFKSLDDGMTDFFAQFGIDEKDPVEFIPPLAMDYADPRTLYYGTNRIWQSLDGGGYWYAISPVLTTGSAKIDWIAVAPADSDTVYATSGTTGNATDPNYFTERASVVQVTTNALSGSATWTKAAAAGLPRRTISRIAVDPIDPATAYVVLSGFGGGHVFRTTDRGATFTDISGNLPDLPANDIAVDPDIPGTLYVANDAGVLVTNNGGSSWAPLGQGLPKVVVHGISLHRSARILRGATHGRSAWDIAVPLPSPSRQPLISSLSPNNVNAAGPSFTLTVNGSNFVSGEVVRWNGRNLSTSFGSATQLTAQVPAANIATIGRATITVFLPATGGGASNAAEFAIGPAPSSTSQAAVSAANPTGGSVLAQRSIASLYGLNLAANRVMAKAAPPLPSTLDDTSLVLGGNNVPLFFVSAGQINFQVPNLGFTKNTSAKLVITHGDLSTTINVTVGPFAPALFTTNAQGSGQASALIAGTSSIAAPAGAFLGSRPAKKGEYISIYCTGLGDVRNRPGLSEASPSSPLSTTLTTPVVTIGGVNATVIFSGLAPGFVSLYQVNVQIPDTAPAGDAVNVNLTIGGVNSNTATVAIQ